MPKRELASGDNVRRLALRSNEVNSGTRRASTSGGYGDKPSDEEKRHKVNTQVLKDFVREQKQTMKVLRQNPIFTTYLKQGASAGRKKERKEQPEQTGRKTFAWEDGSALGATLALIQHTAERQHRDEWGVWSSFGKPYVQIVEKDTEGQRGEGVRDIKKKLPDKVWIPSGEERRRQMELEKAAREPLKLEQEDPEEEPEWQPKPIVKMTWSTEDKREVEFPRVRLQQALHRRAQASAGGGFVDGRQAIEDATSAALLRDSPTSVLTGAPGSSRPGSTASASASPAATASAMVPVPEDSEINAGPASVASGSGVVDVDDNRPISSVSACKVSMEEEPPANPAAPPRAPQWGSGAASGSGLPQLPALDRTDLPVPSRSSSAMAYVPGPDPDDTDSPVAKWRKQFLDVRKTCMSRLAIKLERREERRLRARSDTPYTAALSGQLMKDMRECGGRVSPNPFIAHKVWSRAEKTLAAAKEPETTRRLGTMELQLIERFYEQLCALVEKQRVSDPISVAVVHKVKQLLEGGCILERALLARLCEHLSEFSHVGVGPQEGNAFLMPILQFMRKCTGVSSADLDQMIKANKLQPLLPQAGGTLRQDSSFRGTSGTPNRLKKGGSGGYGDATGGMASTSGGGARRRRGGPSPAPVLRTAGAADLPPAGPGPGHQGAQQTPQQGRGGQAGSRAGQVSSGRGRASPAPLPDMSPENLKGYKTLQKAALQ